MDEDRKPRRKAGGNGLAIRASGKDGPQIIEVTSARWNDGAEQRFLDALGASCNVTHAAMQSGFSKEAIYRRRRTDPGFRARWNDALAQGYVRIEMMLIERAEAVLAGDGPNPDPDHPIPQMSFRDAITLLAQHRPSVTGNGNRRLSWNARPRDLEEVRASILAKFEAIAALPDEA